MLNICLPILSMASISVSPWVYGIICLAPYIFRIVERRLNSGIRGMRRCRIRSSNKRSLGFARIQFEFVAHEAWGFRVTFFIAKKVTKKSSRAINSLTTCSIAWFPGMLARLLWFHFRFLSFVKPHWVLSLLETCHSRGSDNIARQVCADSKWFCSRGSDNFVS